MGDLFLGKHDALRPGWRAFAFYLATFITYGFLQVLLPGLHRVHKSLYPLGLFAVLLVMSRLFLAAEGRDLTSIGLRLNAAWARHFAWGLLGGLGIIGLTAALAYAGGGFRLERSPTQGAAALAYGAAFYLVPAVNEELTFRGYIFRRVEWSLGRWGSLVALSLLFAAAHWSNPGMEGPTRILASVNITLAGVVLGLACLATRSLALPMGIHVAWNWTQGALLGFGVSGTSPRGYLAPVFRGRPEWLTGGAFGLEASLPCTVVCVIAAVVLLLVPWRSKETQP